MACFVCWGDQVSRQLNSCRHWVTGCEISRPPFVFKYPQTSASVRLLSRDALGDLTFWRRRITYLHRDPRSSQEQSTTAVLWNIWSEDTFPLGSIKFNRRGKNYKGLLKISRFCFSREIFLVLPRVRPIMGFFFCSLFLAKTPFLGTILVAPFWLEKYRTILAGRIEQICFSQQLVDCSCRVSVDASRHIHPVSTHWQLRA